MNKQGIIAFCGSKGSGKNTSANIFKEVCNFETEELALAGHLKKACSEIFDIPMENFLDQKLKEKELEEYRVLDQDNLKKVFDAFSLSNYNYTKHVVPHIGKVLRTPRKLLQYIGTDVLHPVDPLVHVKNIVKNRNPKKLTIITDLRFLNEFNCLKESLGYSFIPVYIKNSQAENIAMVDYHPSERELDLFKHQCRFLDNEGNLDQLKKNVKKLFDGEFNEKR